MSQSDLDINRFVRSILVRHWIDLGRLSVRSSDGKLYIRGSLQRIAGIGEKLTSPIVDEMFAEMKRIRDVRQVYATLENWSNDTGSWAPLGAQTTQKGDQQATPQSAGVFEIKQKAGEQ